jgi:hypothetical protein
MIRDIHPGSASRPDRILIFFTHSGSRIQGSKRHWIPDLQHWKNKCILHVVQLSRMYRIDLQVEQYFRINLT